ncbi:MAG: GEVED domain-containing protein, partial [Bacteroidota bacterium]
EVESDGINPLLASISWTDPPGVINTGTPNDNTPVLVNDLDIRITQAGNTYYPHKLTGVAANTIGDNIVDPFERVDVSGASGTYTITVTHKGSLSGGNPQAFSLVVTGITYTGGCTATVPTNVQASVVGTTSATIIWDFVLGADYELRYREVGSPTWTTVSVYTSSYNITGLIELTDYEVQVRSVCPDTTTSDWSTSVYFTTLACTYCNSYGNMNFQTSTTLVDFNTIDNPTGKPAGYNDYTAQSTDVLLNQTYDLTIRVNTDGNYSVRTKVWVDWNQDCDFDDTGEEYDLGTTANQANGMTSNSPLPIIVPAGAALGNTVMRVSTKYSTYPTSCGENFDGEVEDYTVNVISCTGVTKTWNGSNWSPSGTPTFDNPVVIDGNYNTSTGNIECCELTVNNGIILTIESDDYVSVTNGIENFGSIIVDHEGSLVQTDDSGVNGGTGDYTIHKTTRPYIEYDYTYWSSPVIGETINDVFNVNSSVFVPGGEPSNGVDSSPSSYIFWLNTANFNDSTSDGDDYDDEGDDWTHATGTMTPGKGYIAMGAGSDFPFNTDFAEGLTQSVYFESNSTNLNNGTITYSVVLDNDLSDGFQNENLIGNPYASAIHIEDFMAANSGRLTGDFYFWTHDSAISSGNAGPWAYNFTNADYAVATTDGSEGSFAHVNGGSDGTPAPAFIASGQGFIATVLNAGNISFSNSMRVTGPNNQFKTSANPEIDRFWLNMTNNDGVYRQIYIGFRENATDGFQYGQDGKRMQSVVDPDFYSIIPDDNRRFAIQNLATFNEYKTIDLGINILTPGSYTIEIDHIEGIFNTQNIYIKDYKTNTLHNLSQNNYVFAVADDELGEINDRLELRFIDEAAGIDEDVLNSITIYPN